MSTLQSRLERADRLAADNRVLKAERDEMRRNWLACRVENRLLGRQNTRLRNRLDACGRQSKHLLDGIAAARDAAQAVVPDGKREWLAHWLAEHLPAVER